MLFDPVRSADPPIVNGIFLLITAKVNSDDFLVAIVGLSSIIVFLNLLNLFFSELGISPDIAVSYTHLRAHET